MAARLRVFISSPGDVRDAREVGARTVEKIAPDYRRYFDIEPYLWETEALVATGHFQDAIEPPSQFEIVLLILWSRLGTLLPTQTAVRRYEGIDGRSPVTGTEWEYEDALRSARVRGAPDLLVYRSRKAVQIDGWDAERRATQLEQLAALDRFWARHFADRGSFIGAYHEFGDLDGLADLLESHLRQLIERRIAAEIPQDIEQRRVWPGSPFRGLESFEFKHASIFFGREEAVGKALGQLIDNAAAGKAFLLILGASGSGKSSLAKAGMAPRLCLPRRVVGKSFCRRIVFRPGARRDDEDLFDGLAAKLGAPGILPELGEASRIARALRAAPEGGNALIETALDAIGINARESGAMLAHEQATLLLVVDQLEELFTDHRLDSQQRRQFIDLLGVCAKNGRIWVIATMRADFWHRASETPALVSLAQGPGRLDLLPPSHVEISQMIKLPAQSAGLSFETDASGVPLNDRISEAAADAPGVLPLLSYLLEQLYQADVLEARGATLTYASYQRLGGLKGAIASRAEQVLSEQSGDVRAALRSVLFSLVQVDSGPDGATAIASRRAPLSAFETSEPARQLVEALLEPRARLLVADQGVGASPTVRIAHEALLSEWAMARACIADDILLLSIRRMVEERFARWRTTKLERRRGLSGLASEAGLLRDADLSDALRLTKHYRADLPADFVNFVDRSARQNKRRRRAARVGLGVLTCALFAVAFLIYAAEIGRVHARLLDDQAAARDAVSGPSDVDKSHRTAAVRYWGDLVASADELATLQPTSPEWRCDLALGHGWLAYWSPDDSQSNAELRMARQAYDQCEQLDKNGSLRKLEFPELGSWISRQ